jgi:hypothetical protein
VRCEQHHPTTSSRAHINTVHYDFDSDELALELQVVKQPGTFIRTHPSPERAPKDSLVHTRGSASLSKSTMSSFGGSTCSGHKAPEARLITAIAAQHGCNLYSKNIRLAFLYGESLGTYSRTRKSM